MRQERTVQATIFEVFAGHLTDHKGGERLDRIPVEQGEIRIADRAYLQPDRMAAVLAAGGDLLLCSGWESACWRNANGQPFDLIAELRRNAERGLIDQPIWVRRPVLGLRLVAIKKPAPAACHTWKNPARSIG